MWQAAGIQSKKQQIWPRIKILCYSFCTIVFSNQSAIIKTIKGNGVGPFLTVKIALPEGVTDLDKMVETIIEMDKQARKRTEEAEAYQRKAQEELESKEKQILSECLEQAEAEVGELVRSEEQAAEKKLKEAKAANDAAVRRMEALYKEKGAQWVRELVRRALEA